MDGHTLRPENPDRLQGPEIGTLCLIQSPYEWLGNRVVLVLERSYVWAPEVRGEDGFYGHRRYDWTVIEFAPGKTLVVDDTDLQPLEIGDVLVRQSA